MLDEGMLDEFKIESKEMLEGAEEGLLNIEKGQPFEANYNAIFRAFHSLKGAAGMFGIENLQKHMHNLESVFESTKKQGVLSKNHSDYLLLGVDVAKTLLEGAAAQFNYLTPEDFNDETHIATEGIASTGDEGEVDEVFVDENGEVIPRELIESGEYEFEEVPQPLGDFLKTPIQPSLKSLPESTKVFVIDDEPDIVELLGILLEDFGYQVEKFTDASDAISNLELHAPDLIISDINMPNLSGMDFLKTIRNSGEDIPVIFVSGFLTKEIVMEGLLYGAEGFIEKPFKEEEISRCCSKAIARRKASKLLEKSINYILYQFNELDEYLATMGKDDQRILLRNELKHIMDSKKLLKKLQADQSMQL